MAAHNSGSTFYRDAKLRRLDRRNKAGFLLYELSKRGDPKLLSQLRSRALDSPIEMARWRNRGDTDFARILPGSIAGIDETRLRQLVDTEQVDQIIEALN